MGTILQSLRGFVVALLGYLSYVVLNSGSDLIATARRHITDLGGTPPSWLVVQNEPHIIKCLFATILLGLILLLVWSWIEFVIARAIRWIRLVRHTDQISQELPEALLRKDGKWELVEADVNRILKRMVGHPAELKIFVDRVESTPDGRYRPVLRIAAIPSIDQRTTLPVWLHAYFDGATLHQIYRVRDCSRHDPIDFTGVISRADIHKYGDSWTLNVDLRSCAVVN